MEKNNQMDINTSIDFLLSQCVDLQTYSNIMKELFQSGFDKKFTYIDSLNILPKKSGKKK